MATAKNEGPFLIEWIAHHLSIGFDKIFVATNDCTDGSDKILQRLQAVMPEAVFWIDNQIPHENMTFQRSAVRRCLDHTAQHDIDWCLHIDADEFLNIQTENKTVSDFIEPFQERDAVMISWKLFGNDGQNHWDGGSILDTFFACQDDVSKGTAHKVFFKRASFDDCAPHAPKKPKKKRRTLRIVNTLNQEIDTTNTTAVWGSALRTDEALFTWAHGYINHYMVKTPDLTRLKRTRGDANGRKFAKNRRTPDSKEYDEVNRNDTVDDSIQTTRRLRNKVKNQLLGNPEILALHYASITAFFEEILHSETSLRKP